MDIAFLANVVDSLLANKDICFDKKLCTVKEYLDCVRSNWRLRPELRKVALSPGWQKAVLDRYFF